MSHSLVNLDGNHKVVRCTPPLKPSVLLERPIFYLNESTLQDLKRSVTFIGIDGEPFPSSFAR